tara:strand:- start:973 stop:1287 length:315 start_codon:yes stop_codon:yes gene_type:complete
MLMDAESKNDRAIFWAKKSEYAVGYYMVHKAANNVLLDKLQDLDKSIKAIMDFINMELWLAENNSFTKIKDPLILALASISRTEAELVTNIENLKSYNKIGDIL